MVEVHGCKPADPVPPNDTPAVMRSYKPHMKFHQKAAFTVALRAIAGRGVIVSYGRNEEAPWRDEFNLPSLPLAGCFLLSLAVG